EDRVDRDRRLARLTVADDELALAATDVRHRVDRLDSGLERLLHRLPVDDAGRLELERARLVGLDRPAAVERVPERVDDAADLREVGLDVVLLDPLAEDRGDLFRT